MAIRNAVTTASIFESMLADYSDEELELTTRDYIWLASHGVVREMRAFEPRRDACIVECLTRGKAEILRRARDVNGGTLKAAPTAAKPKTRRVTA